MSELRDLDAVTVMLNLQGQFLLWCMRRTNARAGALLATRLEAVAEAQRWFVELEPASENEWWCSIEWLEERGEPVMSTALCGIELLWAIHGEGGGIGEPVGFRVGDRRYIDGGVLRGRDARARAETTSAAR